MGVVLGVVVMAMVVVAVVVVVIVVGIMVVVGVVGDTLAEKEKVQGRCKGWARASFLHARKTCD